MQDYLIINGDKTLIDAPARTWKEHGLEFDGPRRIQDMDWVVLHWTASERVCDRGAHTIFHSLKRRGLSVEFFVDNLGVIYQFMDPGFDSARHAGRVNTRSIGIEVSCYGFGNVPRLGKARDTYMCELQEHKIEVADYYQAQQESVNQLCKVLAEKFDIPKLVERFPYKKREDKYLEDHRGFMGHMHCSSRKYDPGSKPLERLAEFFREDKNGTP